MPYLVARKVHALCDERGGGTVLEHAAEAIAVLQLSAAEERSGGDRRRGELGAQEGKRGVEGRGRREEG